MKVLFVTQEITPYLPETEMSLIGRRLPQYIQELGHEIRTFMPKFGNISERRNQLHEVIRLSGMNLIISDTDHPLIIKVASIQPARLQIYFIDNEDFFHRKSTLADKQNKEFDDNDERAIFYSKGVIETVKKLCWAPDIIHCHGWFSGMLPYFMKKTYANDPLFEDFKIVYSVYDDKFRMPLSTGLKQKLIENGEIPDGADFLNKPDYVNFSKFIINYADGIIFGSDKINPEIKEYIDSSGKPILEYENFEENSAERYNNFYQMLLQE